MTIDDRAHDAARALHSEVAAHVDTEAALAEVLQTPHQRRRWVAPVLGAVAAALLLFAAVSVIVDAGDDGDGDVAIDTNPDPAEGTPLQLLAPDDGRESLRLPITIEPATGLVEGDVVHVTGSGFVPGESVGVVQCTSDAREPVYAGVDACVISPFTQLTADESGAVAGEFTVTRYLTAPYSGTVDCTEAPGRCLIGVGALSNYDRSGGMALEFAPATGEPITIPTASLDSAEGLTDGQLVHLTGAGFTGRTVGLEVCSTSPSVCWQTGDLDQAASMLDGSGGDYQFPPSLVVGSDGTVNGEVAVWRFLPGTEPGTYVDCAVSTCVLRVQSERAPTPLALAFAGTDPAPTAPFVEVTPSQGLGPDSVVTVRGSGFGAVWVSPVVCARQPAEQASPAPGVGTRANMLCTYPDGNFEGIEVADDGTFEGTVELGDFDEYDPANCLDCGIPQIGDDWIFELIVETIMYSEPEATSWFAPPSFGSTPVVIDYHR